MKKLLALILAGTMLVTMPVMAAEEVDDEIEEDVDVEIPSPSASTVKSKPKSKSSDKVSEAPVAAVEASSVPAAIVEAAAAEGKTVGEYMNNAVVTVPGLEYVVPVGQGGHVIINGAPSNQVFSVLKPTLANVYSAKAFAASMNGKVLNVVRVNAAINSFRIAQVNFYMKGIKTGQNIKVFQIANGQWLEVNLVEVRDDHVVVDMMSLGTLAFIEMPAK